MNDYEREHSEFLRRFGAECAVLLKTDGAFPLEAPCQLALYGSGARRTVKGGTGSGEVNSSFFITAEDGLEASRFTISSKTWMDRYGEIYAEAKKDNKKKAEYFQDGPVPCEPGGICDEYVYIQYGFCEQGPGLCLGAFRGAVSGDSGHHAG